jgi:NADPH:quinone reductase-like Zn-dependent oxidoreductase
MRAIQLSQFSIDHLQQVQVEDAPLGRGEVRVRITAASLNARDLIVAGGKYPGVQPPLIPLSDGAGEVIEVGPDVTRFKIGDRVCTVFHPDWQEGVPVGSMLKAALGGSLNGTLREHFTAPQTGLVHAPRSLNDIEAATLCCAGLTAWHAIDEIGQVQAGDTVLLQGTGGVSIFGLQIAKMRGAKAIITSSSDEKLEAARKLGADHTVNYKTKPDWAKEALSFTEGRGVQLVVDVGGGSLNASVDALAVGGRVASVGLLGGRTTELAIPPMIRKLASIHGTTVGSRKSFERFIAAVDAGGLRPVIDSTFTTDNAAEAFKRVASSEHIGKVAVHVFPT